MLFKVEKGEDYFIVDVLGNPENSFERCRLEKRAVNGEMQEATIYFGGYANGVPLSLAREWLALIRQVMFLAEIVDAVFKVVEDFATFEGVTFDGHFGWRMVRASA